MGAITLARALGTELVLPPALHRDSYNSSYEVTPWARQPAGTLLDVQALRDYWLPKGLTIHTVRCIRCSHAGCIGSVSTCPAVPTGILRSHTVLVFPLNISFRRCDLYLRVGQPWLSEVRYIQYICECDSCPTAQLQIPSHGRHGM